MPHSPLTTCALSAAADLGSRRRGLPSCLGRGTRRVFFFFCTAAAAESLITTLPRFRGRDLRCGVVRQYRYKLCKKKTRTAQATAANVPTTTEAKTATLERRATELNGPPFSFWILAIFFNRTAMRFLTATGR